MNNADWQVYFGQTLRDAKSSELLRSRVCHIETDDGPVLIRNGQALIHFGSNDYLGMRRDPHVMRAAARACSTLGAGAGASPLVSGYSLSLAALEQQLAQWQGTPAGLVFSSGFAMNAGAIAALAGADDLLLSDRLNHASLIDGCRLSNAHKRVYPHANVEAVEQILKTERSKYKLALIVTESVFSMDGDIAPLAELLQVCQRYEVGLVVDEAHATGVFGPTGAGMGEELQATDSWLCKLGTLSKAIGTCGGFIAGSQGLVEFMVNRCRSYIYSTAIAPPVVAAAAEAIARMPRLNDRRIRLQAQSQRVRQRLKEQGWNVPDGRTPIIPVLVGSSTAALEISRKLAKAGCYVPAIRPPTVPPNTARLRISLSCLHGDQHVDQLLDALLAARSQS